MPTEEFTLSSYHWCYANHLFSLPNSVWERLV